MTQGFVYGAQASASVFRLAQGRLTLMSAVPVTTSDVLAGTTLYYALYQGNQIGLYTGAQWQQITFAELSIAVPSTTSTMYDVWIYLASGVATLELLAWTNDTTRATALVTQDGIYVKSGDATRRYVGSFRTTTVSGQTEDSLAKRYVWNYYNRIERPMRVIDATVSWTYTTAAYRQANGAAANQLDCVIGVSEDEVYIDVSSASSGTAVNTCRPGIGLNVTNANSAQIYFGAQFDGSQPTNNRAYYRGFPLGRNFFAWLEYGSGASAVTWYGSDSSIMQSGIQGYLRG